MAYLAVFTREKDGKFSVTVPVLPGCFSQGENFENAKKNIEEAIALYLEDEDVEEEQNDILQFAAPVEVKSF